MVKLRSIRSALQANLQLVNYLLEDEAALLRLQKLGKILAQRFQQGGKVLICGNGGSACDAIHFAEELTGKFRAERKALPAISLTDPGHLTCVGNDYGFEEVFSRGVEAYGQPGDTLIALSTSGNSPNVMRAVNIANKRDMLTACFLGRDGGKIKGKGKIEWIISGTTSDRIQEVHMLMLHVLIEEIERNMFPELY